MWQLHPVPGHNSRSTVLSLGKPCSDQLVNPRVMDFATLSTECFMKIYIANYITKYIKYVADHIAIYIKPILNCLRQTINIYIEYWYFLVWHYDFRSWGYGYDMVTYHHNVYGSGIFSWADVFHPQTTSIANSPGPGPGASGHWQFLGKLVKDDCIRVTSAPGTC